MITTWKVLTSSENIWPNTTLVRTFLDMEAIEKEILEDRQTAEGVGEVGEVATIDGATIDPSSSNTV